MADGAFGSRFVPASICPAILHPQRTADRYPAYCNPVRVMYSQALPISSPVADLREYQHKMITASLCMSEKTRELSPGAGRPARLARARRCRPFYWCRRHRQLSRRADNDGQIGNQNNFYNTPLLAIAITIGCWMAQSRTTIR